ncbi:hypothetical protein CR513_55115, partial [Mucuna pruriens]
MTLSIAYKRHRNEELGVKRILSEGRKISRSKKLEVKENVATDGDSTKDWLGKLDTEPKSCIPSRLRPLTSNPSDTRRRTFEGRYENLLNIPKVEVQPAVLSTLTEYYDLPLRCFTFKDFQLAPTLEEYERLLGLLLAKGHYPSWALVAKLLRVSELEIMKKKRNRNNLEGIQRIYLEERLHQLLREEDWPAFIDVYGLLVYGIILFPHLEDYIDLVTVDTFLAKKDRGENLVIAVLANTYYTLNYYYMKNEKSLRCCTPLLYLWMIAPPLSQ